MSFHTEKGDKLDKSDAISMEDWQNRLENFKFKQTDMNKLIMNYLVTGECGGVRDTKYISIGGLVLKAKCEN